MKKELPKKIDVDKSMFGAFVKSGELSLENSMKINEILDYLSAHNLKEGECTACDIVKRGGLVHTSLHTCTPPPTKGCCEPDVVSPDGSVVFRGKDIKEIKDTLSPSKTFSERFDERFPELSVIDRPELGVVSGGYDAKPYVKEFFKTFMEEVVEEIEKEKVDENFNSSWHRENAKGYNQGLQDCRSIIKSKME